MFIGPHQFTHYNTVIFQVTKRALPTPLGEVLGLCGSHSIAFLPGAQSSADWEVQQLRGFSDRPKTIVRTGIKVRLTETFTAKIYAERNALFATSTSRASWIYAFKIERSMRLPMIRAPGTSGYVYRDINGNRKRDEGEPGAGAVIVSRGSETAVTDGNGRYRLGGDTRADVVLDEGSLPLGWIRQSTGSADIPVGSSISAEIRFVIAARSSIEVIEVDLSKLCVIARDKSGREWIARMTGPYVATFEAIPPGEYTLELDLSGVSETLVPRLPLPLLIVDGIDPISINVTLDPRPLKIWMAEPSAGQKPVR